MKIRLYFLHNQTFRSFGVYDDHDDEAIVSIILSCFIYSHTINSQGYVGAAIVFAALGYRIKRRHDASKKRGSVRSGGSKNSEGSRAVYTSVSTRSDCR